MRATLSMGSLKAIRLQKDSTPAARAGAFHINGTAPESASRPKAACSR